MAKTDSVTTTAPADVVLVPALSRRATLVDEWLVQTFAGGRVPVEEWNRIYAAARGLIASLEKE